MALSDCPKCWDKLCSCGWEYSHMSKDSRIKYAATILGINTAQIKDKLSKVIPKNHPQKNNKY